MAACKDCTRAQRRAYGGRSFALMLERNYSITIDQYEDLLASQGGACGSCHRPPSPGARLHVDHDHSCCPAGARSCGKCIRGLLCRTCNTGLGMFYDDPDRLLSAAIYVLSNSRKAVSA